MRGRVEQPGKHVRRYCSGISLICPIVLKRLKKGFMYVQYSTVCTYAKCSTIVPYSTYHGGHHLQERGDGVGGCGIKRHVKFFT